jgi:hypothetical protein
MLVAQALEPEALAAPLDYEKVWEDRGSGADEDGSFWRPLPPEGYVCLGLVAQRGWGKPGLDVVRCVRFDLVAPGKLGDRIWIDKGTGAHTDFGSWTIVPADENGISVGAFEGHTSHVPPTFPISVSVLDARSAERPAP